MKQADWSRDLYSSRIWSLKAILAKPDSKVPKFMQSQAWQKKQLNTALGSWTELKHDTIVYSKQGYGMAQSAMASKAGAWIRNLPAETIHGYVEPVPELYSRIRKSIEQLELFPSFQILLRPRAGYNTPPAERDPYAEAFLREVQRRILAGEGIK